MKHRSSGVSGASIILAGLLLLAPSQSGAAPWLAPAADENIKADWVQDVAKAFKKKEYKNIFMNQPFGCDQCRILGYLNNAAEAIQHDQQKLAKSFVRRALGVLEDGREDGWYTDRDVRPIKRLIIKKANQGFKEAEASGMAMSPPRDRGPDQRYEGEGREPLFSRSDEPDNYYGDKDDRWTGYTEGDTFGLTERLDASRQEQRRDRHATQPRERERHMSREREQDDFSFEDRRQRGAERRSDQRHSRYEDEDRNSRMTREDRDRFSDQRTSEDALEFLFEQEQSS